MLPNLISSLTLSTELVYQAFLSQNIYMIFVMKVFLLIYVRRINQKSICILSTGIVQVSFALVFIYLIGGLAGIGHNSGRILALATPIIAALTAIHLAHIEGIINHSNSNG